MEIFALTIAVALFMFVFFVARMCLLSPKDLFLRRHYRLLARRHRSLVREHHEFLKRSCFSDYCFLPADPEDLSRLKQIRELEEILYFAGVIHWLLVPPVFDFESNFFSWRRYHPYFWFR